jgi:hypothetical protein
MMPQWGRVFPVPFLLQRLPDFSYIKMIDSILFLKLTIRQRIDRLIKVLIKRQNMTIGSATTFFMTGGLAQLGEHLPYKQRVGGSIPSSSTMDFLRSVSGVKRSFHKLA